MYAIIFMVDIVGGGSFSMVLLWWLTAARDTCGGDDMKPFGRIFIEVLTAAAIFRLSKR